MLFVVPNDYYPNGTCVHPEPQMSHVRKNNTLLPVDTQSSTGHGVRTKFIHNAALAVKKLCSDPVPVLRAGVGDLNR
jgi:hypothetical protein